MDNSKATPGANQGLDCYAVIRKTLVAFSTNFKNHFQAAHYYMSKLNICFRAVDINLF